MTRKTVTLQIARDVARELRRGEPESPDGRALAELARELEVEIAQVHPGIEDPALERYFEAHLAEDAEADPVVERLRGCPAVDAAYVKPEDEPP